MFLFAGCQHHLPRTHSDETVAPVPVTLFSSYFLDNGTLTGKDGKFKLETGAGKEASQQLPVFGSPGFNLGPLEPNRKHRHLSRILSRFSGVIVTQRWARGRFHGFGL